MCSFRELGILFAFSTSAVALESTGHRKSLIFTGDGSFLTSLSLSALPSLLPRPIWFWWVPDPYGRILNEANSGSRKGKWKVVKSFEPLSHYNRPKHIQLAKVHWRHKSGLSCVTSEDDNSQAPLKLLRHSRNQSGNSKESPRLLLAANKMSLSRKARCDAMPVP